MKLNLGCGRDYREGYLNVDRVSESAELLCDLESFPYPFRDRSVDEILMRHVLEHVDDIQRVMEELWRILKAEGRLVIYVPHFSHFQALTHPQHKHAFHYDSLAMFTPEASEKYTNKLFHMEESTLLFSSPFLGRIFNRHKYLYTSTFLAYLFPAEQIRFVLRKAELGDPQGGFREKSRGTTKSGAPLRQRRYPDI